MTSKASAARPSSRTTTPASTTSSGSGSAGPADGNEPELGPGSTSISRRSAVASRATKRRLRGVSAIDDEPARDVDRRGLADERRGP